ncbi:MAG: OB-fold nucleic acid binding domain-containing protein, partial [Pseudomonadota bacterium]
MSETQENPIRAEKRSKLKNLRDKGVDPFPHNYERTAQIYEIAHRFETSLEAGEKREGEVFRIAGRLMTKRPMGKAAFFNIQDQSGSIQCYLRKAELDEMGLTSP